MTDPMPADPQSSDFDGPPRRLDPLNDMEPIRMGDINYFHRGRHIEMNVSDKSKKAYGQLVAVNHGDHVTKLGVRWNGSYEERSAHPEQVIRIETIT